MASTGSSWVRRFHPAPGAATRLVCFPHAGGSATFYFPLSAAVSPAAEVLAVQYPGRQDRMNESCITDISTLVDRVTEELLPWADRPLTFLGHSMGATVAFEVARRLEARGIVLLGLFASGRRAPSRRREESVRLRDDQGLVEELRRLSGTDGELLADEAVLSMVLPAMRGDYHAIETYRYQPGPPLNCPVLALTGDSDPLVEVAEARAWAQHTVAPFRLRVLAGGHFFLSEHTETVAREITDHLDAVAPRR
ncbi:thioesterase II family protein [Streptomyces flavofungini]|uniref:Thioesterase n=1 Tax=Streptomyces flavofungini TaxID=68200 RepID=A0ABS0XGY5_9ACTN|nr:alpha/beta fold hydrolase [Streptomyces flavofungini]MBJ3812472.1 thioesterase [Streptomyces flavofungini]GHC53160.1 thioesterase [Streptomyces flavofungini]